ncbi:MAG: adenylate/guanylate cyclase domain-containing protein [Saprospiraceae bacterium]|nr:adenylate/guanylate cyclase domain-containing protein [Saprospiraceae bacterium]
MRQDPDLNKVSKTGERRLAAVVFVDIAGYTSLMQANENDALLVIQHFRDSTEQLVSKHRGQLIQFYGDGALLIFDSAVSAMRYASELQHDVQAAPKVPLRIGIHQGDVILADGNIFGNTVNVAARVESMGVPGAVLFSDKVRTDLSNQTGFEAASLGHFEFKNVADPLEVFALVEEGLVVPAIDGLKGKFKEEQTIKSIGVLPFVNRSSDPEQDYFAEGVAEEIMTGLGSMDLLKVAGRASSFMFKDSKEPVHIIATKLQVDHLLCGSVRKMGQRVRVTAELLNAADGFQMWTERYDKQIDDIFQIQDEIAAQVIQALKVLLINRGSEETPLITPKTTNMEAFDLYLKGKSFLDRRFNTSKALECFRQAIELDPDFGDAYNSLAYAHIYDLLIANAHPNTGYANAQRLLEIASDRLGPNVESTTIRAWLDFYCHHDYAASFEGFDRAILLDPMHSDTYRIKAYMHLLMDEREEALANGRRALELDPLSTNNKLSYWEMQCKAGVDFDARATYDDLRSLGIAEGITNEILGQYYWDRGLIDEAGQCYERIGEYPQILNLNTLSQYVFQAKHGDRRIAEGRYRGLVSLKDGAYLKPSYLAILSYYLGDLEKAARHVAQAATENDPMMIQLHKLAIYSQFFSWPPTIQALKALGLPWQRAHMNR